MGHHLLMFKLAIVSHAQCKKKGWRIHFRYPVIAWFWVYRLWMTIFTFQARCSRLGSHVMEFESMLLTILMAQNRVGILQKMLKFLLSLESIISSSWWKSDFCGQYCHNIVCIDIFPRHLLRIFSQSRFFTACSLTCLRAFSYLDSIQTKLFATEYSTKIFLFKNLKLTEPMLLNFGMNRVRIIVLNWRQT